MRLKYLKLNGFKSFVDNTMVSFPGNLVAVVGPNGCGKSNIIDALRWVMGESSAKSLRGESMSDVIFNGSSQRKASGQASVELCFDNNLGRLDGPFGSYPEIVVKRIVTRDGESAYFLNKQRCRRRDVTDLFLGTGAGARSYSIISQGTISQFIEARPEELRAHLEEAAGISKYKERRRETLTRMEHTRENLQRIQDIYLELDKQVNRLQQQANNARLYQELSQKLREGRVTLLALKWQNLQEKRAVEQQTFDRVYTHIYECKSRRASLIRERSELEQKQQELQTDLQTLQEKFYQYSTEIARTEEIQRQTRQQQIEREAGRQQLKEDIQTLMVQITEDRKNLEQCTVRIGEQEALFPKLQDRLHQAQQESNLLGAQKSAQERAVQETRERAQKAEHARQLLQVRVDQLYDKKQHLFMAAENFSSSRYTEELNTVSGCLHSLQQNRERIEQTVTEEERALGKIKQQRNMREHSQLSLQQERALLESRFQETLREQTLVQAQLDAHARQYSTSEALKLWQKDKTRLLTCIKVDPQWQSLVEWVLQDALTGFLLDDLDPLCSDASMLIKSGISAFTTAFKHSETHPGNTLAEKITGPVPHWLPKLETIYLSDTLETARTLLQTLDPFCSVLSQDGFWLGHGWIKALGKAEQERPSLLSLQQMHETLKSVQKKLQAEQHECQERCHTVKADLNACNTEIDKLQQQLFSSKETQQRILLEYEQQKKQQRYLQQQIEEANAGRTRLTEELETLTQTLLEAETTLRDAEEESRKAQSALSKCLADYKEPLIARAQENISALEQERNQLQVSLESLRQRKEQLQLAIERSQQQCVIFQERLEKMERYTDTPSDAHTLKEKLQELNQLRQKIEEKIIKVQNALKEQTSGLKQQNKEILRLEEQTEHSEKQLQQHQLNVQEMTVRAEGLREQIEEMDGNLEQACRMAAAAADILSSEQDIVELEQKIHRLGAINLAAIDEYEVEKERKNLLESEHKDLSEALQTLEEAIGQIDQETYIRLKDTFDAVNTTFQQLFPRLFGGGKASLLVNHDNLLEAGIVVMAQPPGKRNTRIQMLSGGEKAMTAVALVFAIFQLNPSPFCMLDEVDAPLDDGNVGRFCELVKEMSSLVQFLFITHNKVTMEMAEQLIGITMREPGVSKVVSVDIKQTLDAVPAADLLKAND